MSTKNGTSTSKDPRFEVVATIPGVNKKLLTPEGETLFTIINKGISNDRSNDKGSLFILTRSAFDNADHHKYNKLAAQLLEKIPKVYKDFAKLQSDAGDLLSDLKKMARDFEKKVQKRLTRTVGYNCHLSVALEKPFPRAYCRLPQKNGEIHFNDTSFNIADLLSCSENLSKNRTSTAGTISSVKYHDKTPIKTRGIRYQLTLASFVITHNIGKRIAIAKSKNDKEYKDCLLSRVESARILSDFFKALPEAKVPEYAASNNNYNSMEKAIRHNFIKEPDYRSFLSFGSEKIGIFANMEVFRRQLIDSSPSEDSFHDKPDLLSIFQEAESEYHSDLSHEEEMQPSEEFLTDGYVKLWSDEKSEYYQCFQNLRSRTTSPK